MVPLTALWLPIVLSAVIVFIASSIMHMVLPHHKSDYRKVPDEDKVRATLRSASLSRGLYMIPFCTPKEMKSPEMAAQYKEGPVAMITVFPNGTPVLPKFLGMWFVYCLIISFFVAYLTGRTVPPESAYPAVFRVAGTAAFLTYGLGPLANGIWKGQPWGVVIKEVIDGLLYALLTGGTFGWLWPK
jgi:hypothetical protein